MTAEKYAYDAREIPTISIESVKAQPTMVFGADLWLGIFESCLRQFFPLNLNYRTIRVGIELNGALCFGDDGVDYLAQAFQSEASDSSSGSESDSGARRPIGGFALNALMRGCVWLRCHVNRDGRPHVIADEGAHQESSPFEWESTARNVLRISPGGTGRTAEWLAGRLRGFAVANPGMRIEIWDERLGMVSSCVLPRGVASVVAEENAHLLQTSEVLCFETSGPGFVCRIAMQFYQFGRPKRITFVNGVRMNRAGSEHNGLWQGIASALGIADASKVRRYVERERWSIGTTISVHSSGTVQMGASWGDYVNDEAIQLAVAEHIASEFGQEYQRQSQLPGFRGHALVDLARHISRFTEA